MRCRGGARTGGGGGVRNYGYCLRHLSVIEIRRGGLDEGGRIDVVQDTAASIAICKHVAAATVVVAIIIVTAARREASV